MNPAGPENGIGIISTGFLKDWTDPAWSEDPAMKTWHAFMMKYMPGANLANGGYIAAYSMSMTMLQVLKQCRGDFSRANVIREAESLHALEIPVLLPGIKISTSRTDHRPIKAMRLMRWTGKTWQYFGNLIEGANV
jgi:branched-chain amino acid transport system substrate-binding protein